MSHYYSPQQDSILQLKKIEAVLRGKKFSFFTGSGVFSKDKVDFGTAVLAEYMQVSENDRVLDLGCGIGVIGKVASTLTKKEVILVDVIVFNPPQSAGKKLCMQMIYDAKEHLSFHGSLQVVARHNKGGETFSKYMQEVYGNVETLCRKGGYRVYKSVLQ